MPELLVLASAPILHGVLQLARLEVTRAAVLRRIVPAVDLVGLAQCFSCRPQIEVFAGALRAPKKS